MKCCGQPWTYGRVLEILRNPKYVGIAAWGRTTGLLGIKRVKVAQERWTVKTGAFEAIIDQKMFDAAQRALRDRTQNKSNEELLCGLKELLKREGRLSEHIIDASSVVPVTATYQRRFGGVTQAYALIGYHECHSPGDALRMRRRHHKIEQTLLRRILATFPGDVSLIRERDGCRRVLRFWDGLKVSVLICQCVTTTRRAAPRWNVYVNPYEHCYTTLICRCTPNNEAFKDFYVVSSVDAPSKFEDKTPRRRMFRIKENDLWLKRGKRLVDLRQLRRLADLVQTKSTGES